MSGTVSAHCANHWNVACAPGTSASWAPFSCVGSTLLAGARARRRERHVEAGPAAVGGLVPDAAAHGLDQAAHEGQPETRAPPAVMVVAGEAAQGREQRRCERIR